MTHSVCVYTSTRADFGMLVPLLNALKSDPEFSLRLLVSGTHLSQRHGHTIDEIKAEKFEVLDCIDIDIDTSPTTAVFGNAIKLYGEYFSNTHYDLLIVLGDRFETLAATTAAYMNHLPVAHICGGESTVGALDEAYRHSITKMASIHFTTTEVYRSRVIQLGEHPDHVLNTGGLFIDGIMTTKLLDRQTLCEKLGIPLEKHLAVATFHPQTLSSTSCERDFAELLTALKKRPDVFSFFTYANADHGGAEINHMIDEFIEEHPQQSHAKPSLGRVLYFSLLKHARFVIGNSSSGVLEAPSFQVPTVNIGTRQKGRIRADSVIDCECNDAAIAAAIDKALSNQFRTLCLKATNPHGDGTAAPRMLKFLKEQLNKGIDPEKSFCDLV